jgi:hypothetical protein
MMLITSAVKLVYETMSFLVICAANGFRCNCQVGSDAEVSRRDSEQQFASFVHVSSLSMVEMFDEQSEKAGGLVRAARLRT